MNDRGLSIKNTNVTLEYLRTFFLSNGFKNGKSLDVERYHQPARYRKRAEYIPSKEEIDAMIKATANVVAHPGKVRMLALKWKAVIIWLYCCGFRNSTFRAILYRDIKDEIENPLTKTLLLRSYPEMKAIVPTRLQK
jgi:hypothetical protein